MRPRVPAFWAVLAIIVGAAVVEYFSDDRVFRSMTEFVMGYSAYRIATIYRPGASSALAGIAFVVPFVASGVVGPRIARSCRYRFHGKYVFDVGFGERTVPDILHFEAAGIFWRNLILDILLQWLVFIGWKHGLAKLPFFAAHLYAMVFLRPRLSYCARSRAIIFSKNRHGPSCGEWAGAEPRTDLYIRSTSTEGINCRLCLSGVEV